MTTQIDFGFSSPIHRTSVAGFAEQQVRILDHILDRRDGDRQGIVSSNFEGWHSRRDVHLDRDEPMPWIVRTIGLAATRFISHLTQGDSGVEVLIKECWFNVHPSGGWNMPHTHPAWWSGVLYVSGEFETGSGDIMFFNPIPESVRGGYPHHKILTPRSGELILFPGHLMHMVMPYKGTEPRVSISFNIDPKERISLEGLTD